jgi:hypothetical protein
MSVDLAWKEPASSHPGVDIEMVVDGTTAQHSSRGQVGRCLAAAHLLLNVELSNSLLHFRLERHPESKQGNVQPKPTNRLRFGVGANAEHVGAGLNRNGTERFESVTVGIGFHDDAEFRRSN